MSMNPFPCLRPCFSDPDNDETATTLCTLCETTTSTPSTTLRCSCQPSLSTPKTYITTQDLRRPSRQTHAFASMAAPRSDRVYHQDYIARIRYSNTLPPPPNPPKLLDIPDVSLSSGLYTSPTFAARLLRDQPLNIEADAELGMPLNLIGLPGVFDGDESSTYRQ